MKKVFFILFFLPVLILAQVPQGIGYQGVATNANGFELINHSISIRASIISGSANGTVEWQETHSTATDSFGLFTISIGQGTSTTNGTQSSFGDISWGTNTHFLKIEMDINGGSNYSLIGTNQMMSVPYALYAESTNINYDSIATILSNDTSFTNNISSVINSTDNNDEIGNFINNSQLNGFRFFYIREYFKIYESDSSGLTNLLYEEPTGNSNGQVNHLFVDHVNQELYYLESPYINGPATMVKKTSLVNFNPQTIYVVPLAFDEIIDFTVNTTTGGLYFAIGSNAPSNRQGIYSYESSTFNKIYSTSIGDIYSICIGAGGNIFFAREGKAYDLQNNILFSTPTTNDGILEYDAPSDTYYLSAYSKIFDDQGNLIYETPSGSGSIYDMKINSSTQKIIMTFNSTVGMVDFSGSNFTALGIASSYIRSVAYY